MLVVGCYFGLIPWNMERLQIDESDLGFAILTFGVSFLISNQIAGRILVPKFGTKKIKLTSKKNLLVKFNSQKLIDQMKNKIF